jgi:hypothetical protein
MFLQITLLFIATDIVTIAAHLNNPSSVAMILFGTALVSYVVLDADGRPSVSAVDLCLSPRWGASYPDPGVPHSVSCCRHCRTLVGRAEFELTAR